MNELNERLLDAWLNISSIVDNGRLAAGLPFNEAYVCNLLYRQKCMDSSVCLTATELCEKTRILKSQMNKVLVSLEKRGLIERVRATCDRRKVYIRLRDEKVDCFMKVHAATMDIVDAVIGEVGEEKAEQAIRLLSELATCVDRYRPNDEDRVQTIGYEDKE